MIAINDKVVCVNDYQSGYYSYPNGGVKKGSVYVVEGIKIQEFCDLPNPIVALFLVGFPRLNGIGENIPWSSFDFRRLEEVKEINRLKAQIGEPQEAFL